MDLTTTVAFAANRELMLVDISAVEQSTAAHNRKLDEANRKPPTDQDLQNEYYRLKADYEKRCFDAKQAEGTVNRAADRLKYFQNQLNLLKSTVPASEYERLLAKFQAGERVYKYAEAIRKIASVEEDLIAATGFFNRMKGISVDHARSLKAFEKHQLARLEELKPIVAKQDATYSYIKGTARTKGWGRW